MDISISFKKKELKPLFWSQVLIIFSFSHKHVGIVFGQEKSYFIFSFSTSIELSNIYIYIGDALRIYKMKPFLVNE